MAASEPPPDESDPTLETSACVSAGGANFRGSTLALRPSRNASAPS